MIDRFEILVSDLRRFVSRHRWSARLLGLAPGVASDGEPGLIVVQIDGLGETPFRDAIARGDMPFLAHLVQDEAHRIVPLYSGLPSSTPAVQAELFYGIPNAVPAFGYFDRVAGRRLSMNDPSAAARIERRLRARSPGLLEDGSSWSNIYSGSASEAHLCASTAGLGMLLSALHPIRVAAVLLWNVAGLLRIAYTTLVEAVVAIGDLVTRRVWGSELWAELRFVPERLVVTAVMREVVTAGACIDVERGQRIVHLNLLGYDEHAHRRGPDSRVARWTLRGIDRSVRRVWNAAHRSHARDYQVWVLSDHGQEATVPWNEHSDRSLVDAVGAALRPHVENAAASPGPSPTPPPESGRARWLRRMWRSEGVEGPAPDESDQDARPETTTIIGEGPVGSVTLPFEPDFALCARLARAVAEDAQVPMVLFEGPDDAVSVHRRDGRTFRLPEDAADVLGADHPHLREAAADLVRIVRHRHAGDLVLSGFEPGSPRSLQLERGSHGGPGPHETSAFVVLPPETRDHRERLRPRQLYELARRVRSGDLPSGTSSSVARRPLRIMTYNVHGCRGMDGRHSPARIARVIARARPDVVCLQELDRTRARSHAHDQAAMIARTLSTEYHFHPVAEIDDGTFGNAILTPLPSKLVDAGPLPGWKDARLPPRGVLWVEIEVAGRPLQVLVTHLSVVRPERRGQIAALVGERWVGRALERGPTVLCGDLNAAASSRGVRRIDAVLPRARDPRRREPSRTWSSRLPVRAIDHLFASEDLSIEAVFTPRDRLGKIASDHLPLVVDLWVPTDEDAGLRSTSTPSPPSA